MELEIANLQKYGRRKGEGPLKSPWQMWSLEQTENLWQTESPGINRKERRIYMNLSTLIILVILAVIIGAVVRIMIRDKKAGKGCGGCAGGCGGCAGSSMCHGYHEHGKREG